MFPRILITTLMLAPAFAQQPPVKVNVLNVCRPSADEQAQLTSALAKIPVKPQFGDDYEVARGHSVLDPATPIPGMPDLPPGAVSAADWVRVRREFPAASPFTNVQYSFSVDSENMVETLVLKLRDPKDLLQISIEDTASSVTSAAAMLSMSTPVSRIRLERLGKSSVALSRCRAEEGRPATDQASYEPIFQAGSSIMQRYRESLSARKIVPQELAHLHPGPGTSARPAKTNAGGEKK